MKTEIIKVSGKGLGINEAIAATVSAGEECGLTKKENLRLRLIAEEIFGMASGIIGEIEGFYYVCAKDKSFEVHLNADVDLSKESKKKLLELSTTGTNSGVKSFMSKIRDMIGTALLPKEDGPSTLSLGLMSMGSPASARAGSTANIYNWSLSDYRAAVKNAGEEGIEAWDELEKSIVANIADEITVSVLGYKVELTVFKKF